MHLLIVATLILSSIAMENYQEVSRNLIAKNEDYNSLPDDAFEIAAIALGFPISSSSDWFVGSKADRAIMTKVFARGNGPDPNQFAHWCSGYADQNQWLQVSFLQPRIVTAVSLRGVVTSFKIQYSNDGINWLRYNNDSILKGSMVEGNDANYVSKVVL